MDVPDAITLVREMLVDERRRCAQIARDKKYNSEVASYPYDGGSGPMGYERACNEIEEEICKLGVNP